MKVRLRQIDGLAMVAAGDSNHWVAMDGPVEFGGYMAGTRPMELILMGLAGCSAMDIVSILRKMHVELTDCSVDVEAEQAEQHPQVFTKIHLRYAFTGKGLRPANIEKAIDLTDNKYCSATAMLRKSIAISHSYEIIEAGTS
jgi:putative redox protein